MARAIPQLFRKRVKTEYERTDIHGNLVTEQGEDKVTESVDFKLYLSLPEAYELLFTAVIGKGVIKEKLKATRPGTSWDLEYVSSDLMRAFGLFAGTHIDPTSLAATSGQLGNEELITGVLTAMRKGLSQAESFVFDAPSFETSPDELPPGVVIVQD